MFGAVVHKLEVFISPPCNMYVAFSFPEKTGLIALVSKRNPVTSNILVINTYEGLSQMCIVEQ